MLPPLPWKRVLALKRGGVVNVSAGQLWQSSFRKGPQVSEFWFTSWCRDRVWRVVAAAHTQGCCTGWGFLQSARRCPQGRWLTAAHKPSGPSSVCCPVAILDVSSVPPPPLHPHSWYPGASEGRGLHGLRPSPGALGMGLVLRLGRCQESSPCVAWPDG